MSRPRSPPRSAERDSQRSGQVVAFEAEENHDVADGRLVQGIADAEEQLLPCLARLGFDGAFTGPVRAATVTQNGDDPVIFQ